MTHEHLAYAPCPICRQSVHMLDMYLHMTSRHKELNPKHCRRLCDDRLLLYERHIGVKLKKIELDDAASKVMDYLPTLVEGGGYLCNWCPKKEHLWPTRDAFLGHVAKTHPDIDVEEIEPHVGHNNQTIQRIRKLTTASEAKGPRRRFTQTIATVPDYAISSAPPAPVYTETIAAAAKQPSSSPPTQQQNAKPDLTFRSDHFPCELCGRCYQTEADLLKHLENSHPLGVLDHTNGAPATEGERLALDDIRRMQQMDMHTASIAVPCDLCTKTAVFTRRSALYAHLRIKHPNVDANTAMERMLEAKHNTTFSCPECKKAFGSMSALEAHRAEKHQSPSPPTTTTTSHSPIVTTTLRPTMLSASWWCNDCEKGFASARALLGHLTGKHSLPTAALPCPACKRVFVDVYSLKEHVGLIHKNLEVADIKGEVHAPCDDCGRNFISYEALHVHQVRHHGRKKEEAPKAAAASTPTEVMTNHPLSTPSSATVTAPAAGGTASPRPSSSGSGKPRVVAKRKVIVDEILASDVTFV